MVFTRCVIRRWDMITLRVSAARMLLILFGDILGGSRSLFLRFSCKQFTKSESKIMFGSCDELFFFVGRGVKLSCTRSTRDNTKKSICSTLVMRVQSSRAAKFLMVQTPEVTSAVGENPDNTCNTDITEVCWYLNPRGKVVFLFFLQKLEPAAYQHIILKD